MRTRVLGLILFSLMLSPLMALDLRNVDLSHQYDPDAPIKLSYRVIQTGNTITLFLEVTSDSTVSWIRSFLVQENYSSEVHREITPILQEMVATSTSWKGSVSFEPSESESLAIIKYSSDFDFYFDIPLKNGTANHTSFYPVVEGSPVVQPYLRSNKLDWVNEPIVQVTNYEDFFGPAEAPMNEMGALVPIFREDSVFIMQDSTFLRDYRFYFFQNDTLRDSGLTLLKTPPYYPEYRLIEELIPPLKYITTEAEYRALSGTRRVQATFDEFWINTYGTKFRARNAIRRYYRGVSLANEYFTSYKQGWKTDQGMILIIYGTPIEMYRDDRGERWVYDNVTYEFIKVPTLFGPIYVLLKDKKYEREWYDQVGQIRKGE